MSPSENWLYHFLHNLPTARVAILARRYSEDAALHGGFRLVRYPLDGRLKRETPHHARPYLERAIAAASRAQARLVARRTGQVDIVHSHFADVAWHNVEVAEQLSVPHIVSFYGYDYGQLLSSDGRWADRYDHLFRQASAFFCEGPYAASALADLGCPNEKIHVVRLGVDVSQIPFSTRSKRPNSLRIVQVARAKEKKGFDSSLGGFSLATKSCPNMTLTVAGPMQHEERELRRLSKALGVADKVRFIGPIAPGKLHSFLSNFDVFLHPSRFAINGDCEGGAPIVLLDAQATGLPVISTTHCDIPTIVEGGASGFLAPERDLPALASHIETFYLMGNGDYEAMSRHARHFVETMFSASRTAAVAEDHYEDIVKRTDSPSG